MERTLVFDTQVNWMRAAVIEDGKLCEIHRERERMKDPTESLYLGRVVQIRPTLGSAFLDIGEELNAFLPMQEGEQIRCGDLLIVQGAAKQSTDTKGLRVSRKINLSGRSLVLIPGEDDVRISKKIRDEQQREMLKEAGERICPDGYGMIIRTVGEQTSESSFREEAKVLSARWEEILLRAKGMKAPGLLWSAPGLEERIIRDLSGKALMRIVSNDEEQYQRLLERQERGMILPQVRIEYHDERNGLVFDVFSIEAAIDKALKKRVWLPCGGYLIMDSCEAMTVIDVNSGKMMLGRSIEEMALSVNLEAADEIARQIRLRNTGGMIVVDFIDMERSENRSLVEQRMQAAVRADRSKVDILGFTRLGLLEMTRKREKAEIRKQMRISCSYCSGMGELLSGEEVAIRALQQIRRLHASGQRGPFVIRCASAAADALASMENPIDDTRIYVLQAAKHAERAEIEQIGCSDPVPAGAAELRRKKEL